MNDLDKEQYAKAAEEIAKRNEENISKLDEVEDLSPIDKINGVALLSITAGLTVLNFQMIRIGDALENLCELMGEKKE